MKEKTKVYIKKHYPFMDKLGKIPDTKIAEEYGICRERIRQIRKCFNIAKTIKTNENKDMYKHTGGGVQIPIEALSQSTKDLCEKYGLCKNSIYHRRKYYKIKAPERKINIPKYVLASMTCAAIAKIYNCHPVTVAKKRKEAAIRLLNQVFIPMKDLVDLTTSEIAHKYAVHSATARKRKKLYGITTGIRKRVITGGKK
jgi:hypothetical protein